MVRRAFCPNSARTTLPRVPPPLATPPSSTPCSKACPTKRTSSIPSTKSSCLETQRTDPRAKLPKSKSAWSLAANMALAKSTFIAVAPNGDAQRVDMNDADGTKMDVWANPRMANRGRRHLMETVLQLSKGRIPIAADKALRAYAMYDVSVFNHPDKKYDGNGVYLSQGVLKARQAVVFNVVLDEEGNPITRKQVVRVKNMDPVTGFEYYTNVEKSHVTYEMVQ